MHDLPPDYAFSNPSPDHADRLRNDPEALRALWPDARVLLLDRHGDAAASEDGRRHAWMRGAEFGAQMPEAALFLALHEGHAWFSVATGTFAEDARRIDLRAAALTLPAFDAGLHAQARALANWHAGHRFCPNCGQRLRMIRAGHAARCDHCGREHFPRIDTAIIVAVSDGQRLLLGRQADWPARRYSVIAGFLEPGERLEDAVAREVAEETGVRVRSCRYVGSQPWPFPANLMVGFEAQAEADEPRFGDELEDARWFTAAQIHDAVAAGDMQLASRLSISSWLIRRWLAQQGGKRMD